MALSARQINCEYVEVSTLVEQQQQFLISREIFIVSYSAATFMRPAASLVCASGNQAALGVRETLLRVARRAASSTDSLGTGLRRVRACPPHGVATSHWGSTSGSFDVTDAIDRRPCKLLRLDFRARFLHRPDWHWPN